MKIEIFIPGILKNHANSRVAWWHESKYAKDWRRRVESYVTSALGQAGWRLDGHTIYSADRRIPDTVPKLIRVHIITAVRFDEEGLLRSTKAIVDGLQYGKVQKKRGLTYRMPGAPIINDDGPKHVGAYEDPTKHTIIRTQEPGRPKKKTPLIDPRGVKLTICLKEDAR